MTSTVELLKIKFNQALVAAFGEDFATTDPMVVEATNPKFGDYQCNVAMSLTKPVKSNTRAIATQIINHLSLDEICEPPEIAGPGFINLRLKTDYLKT
ncbi:MAG: arginine--tRNA ligase, partial [Planktothrix sp.]